jgi:hypothetical protein
MRNYIYFNRYSCIKGKRFSSKGLSALLLFEISPYSKKGG